MCIVKIFMGRYKRVYRVMTEDTTDGSRKGRCGGIKYDSVRKGARTKKKTKPWGKKRK